MSEVASADNDELAALRAQRLQAMQHEIENRAAQQVEAQLQAEEVARQEADLDAAVRQHLTPEARSRLTRISLVEPARVKLIKSELALRFQNGTLPSPLNDHDLKRFLSDQQSKSRSNASIRRI